MSKLKTYKFSDLYTMSSGISSKPEQAGIGSPFLSFKTVFNNHFVPDVLEELMDISEKEKEIYSIKKGDIFLTRTSETLDELGMSCVALENYPNASFSGFLKRLRPNQSNITYDKFMGFYLRSDLFRKTMTNNSIMTLRASLNEQIFSYLELVLPDYKEQKKAGDFLYLLSKKIDLNNQINIELEKIAKTIYDYWFIQFDFPDTNGNPYKSSGGKMIYSKELKREIPENWEIKKMQTILKKNSSKFDFGVDNFDTIDLSVMPTGSMCLDKRNHSSSFGTNLYLLKKYDILFGAIRPYLLKAGFAPFDGLVTGTVHSYRVIKEDDYNFALLTMVQENMFKFAVANSKGTKMPVIGSDDLLSYRTAYNSEIVKKFNSIVSFKEIISQNISENQKLAELRDWLLPMLMNGQVTVSSDANIGKDEVLAMVAEPSTIYEKTVKVVIENVATKKTKREKTPVVKLNNVDVYKRTLLAAEIVFQYKNEYTLGHLKLQKMLYLCKESENMNLPMNFLKQAMGPYDNQLARSLDKQFEEKKWFKYQNGDGLKYTPLENCGKHSEDFKKYFEDQLPTIHSLITTFKKFKSQDIEAVATLYACWKEAILKNELINDIIIIKKFYEWSDEKIKFKEADLIKHLNWMRVNSIYPIINK